MSQYTSVGLPCPLPSQLLSCSVIFPVRCTVSSLALFLKSIFFSWEEGQDKQWSAAQKRLRDIAEEKNPDVKIQREEDGKEVKRNFFSRDTTRQSLTNIDIEMSSEPSATPVFTTRTTPVQDPLLALDTPPKKLDQRVDGQVFIHEDGLLKGVRVKWSVSSKTYFFTCDMSVHHGNCTTSRCPLLTGNRTSASTEVSLTVEEPRTRLVGGVSSSKSTINYDIMQIDPFNSTGKVVCVVFVFNLQHSCCYHQNIQMY